MSIIQNDVIMNKNSNLKIIVLGIDGLEYNLVKKWKLQNILQEKYCKTDLSDYTVKVTPPIWGSMLTGKVDEEIMRIWEKSAKIVGLKSDVKQVWWAKLGIKILDLAPDKIRTKIENKFIENIGENPCEKSANYINDKNLINIFQFYKNPWTNGIPGFGRFDNNPTKRKLFKIALEGNKEPFRKYVLDQYKKEKKELFNILEKKENDLVFWYTPLLDSLGHIYISESINLMNYYLEINELAGSIRSKYQDSKIYVISDHGMEAVKGRFGMHSDYGFFSSNTGETIEKPLHLYDLLLKFKSK